MGVLFVLRELRADEPVLNPRLFRNSVFAVSTLAGAFQFAAMYAAIYYLPLFVQGVMGKTATSSGIILMPMMAGAILTSIGAGQLLARTGRYKVVLIVSFAVATGAMYLVSRMGISTSRSTLIFNMFVLGLGLGVAMSSFTVIVQNQYPVSRLGEVSAGLQFFRTIASTIGLAIFGTILNSGFSSAMRGTLSPQVKTALGTKAAQLDNPQTLLSTNSQTELKRLFAGFADPVTAFNSFMDTVRHALQHSISTLFLVGTFVVAAGFVVVLFLKEVPLRTTHMKEADDLAVDELVEAGVAD